MPLFPAISDLFQSTERAVLPRWRRPRRGRSTKTLLKGNQLLWPCRLPKKIHPIFQFAPRLFSNKVTKALFKDGASTVAAQVWFQARPAGVALKPPRTHISTICVRQSVNKQHRLSEATVERNEKRGRDISVERETSVASVGNNPNKQSHFLHMKYSSLNCWFSLHVF